MAGSTASAGYLSAGKSCLRTILPYYTWPAPLSCGEASSGIGSKHDGKQNYLCRDCYRQFVGDHNLTYPGCHSGIDRTILKMLVRNVAFVIFLNNGMQQGQSSEDTKNIITPCPSWEKSLWLFGSWRALDFCWRQKEQGMAYLRLWLWWQRDSGLYLGKEEYCHHEGIGSTFKRAKGYLWECCYGQMTEFCWNIWQWKIESWQEIYGGNWGQ